MELGSKEIATAAVKIALTASREEEKSLQSFFKEQNILTAAADYGGEFSLSVLKVVERALVSAKREGVIGDSHAEQGAIAGAAHEALLQMINKAMGLNVGGKIGIARHGDHISVAIFLAIGLLNLNDIAIGLGHRVI